MRAIDELARRSVEAPKRLVPRALDSLRAAAGDGAITYALVAGSFHFINRIADLLHVDSEALPEVLRRFELLRRLSVRVAARLFRRVDLANRPYGQSYEQAIAELSSLDTIQISPGQSLTLEGNSLIYLLAKYAVFGQLLPQPSSYGEVTPVLYWLRYFFTSQPMPVGGMDVMIHPVAWAGWAGLLVTALNLIPAGQLDGGHISFAMFGEKTHYKISVVAFSVMFIFRLLGFADSFLELNYGIGWSGWLFWSLILYFVIKLKHPPVLDATQLDPRRMQVGYFSLFIFLISFSPMPIMLTLPQ